VTATVGGVFAGSTTAYVFVAEAVRPPLSV
jgi:hypothetical protein